MRQEYQKLLFELVKENILVNWKGSLIRSKDESKNALIFWKYCSLQEIWLFIKLRVDPSAESFSCEVGWNITQTLKVPDVFDSRTYDFKGGSYTLEANCIGLKLLADGNDGFWYIVTLEELGEPSYYETVHLPIAEHDAKTKLEPLLSDFFSKLYEIGIPYIEGKCKN